MLTDAEAEAALAGLLEDAEAGPGADQARRDLLRLAAESLRAGDPLPVELSRWLGHQLLELHAALDAGQDQAGLRQDLVGLGRRLRGRQAKGAGPAHRDADLDPQAWRDMEIAAAAAVLADLAGVAGVHGIKESISEANGCSVDTADRACDDNLVVMGSEALRELAQGLAAPVIRALRLSVRRAPQRHHKQIRDLLRGHPHL